MTKESAAATPRRESKVVPWGDFEAFSGMNQRLIDNAAKSHAAMVDGMSKLYEEMSGLVETRVREDMSAYEELMRCRTPGDFFACERQFVERATAQYLEAAGQMAALTARVAGAAWAPLNASAGTPEARQGAKSS